MNLAIPLHDTVDELVIDSNNVKELKISYTWNLVIKGIKGDIFK